MIHHRTVDTNGITMHVAEAGPEDGPAVVLCHGFPECWYSWRHQLTALGDAGYRVIAPDQRGYGQTDMPDDIASYTMLHLVGDIVGLLDASGIDEAVVVGHDWGAPVAWFSALLRPDRFRAVAALSVHFNRPQPIAKPPVLPTDLLRAFAGDGFFYILYFQEPGVAERLLDADPRGFYRKMMFTVSGDFTTGRRFHPSEAEDINEVLEEPPGPLPWLTEEDLDEFVASFSHHGTFFGGLNWYRNMDRNALLLAPFVGRQIEQPALFIGAEHDVIVGQTHDAVLATRPWVPALREPTWIDGSGHWIQQERPDEVNGLLLDFLGSL